MVSITQQHGLLGHLVKVLGIYVFLGLEYDLLVDALGVPLLFSRQLASVPGKLAIDKHVLVDKEVVRIVSVVIKSLVWGPILVKSILSSTRLPGTQKLSSGVLTWLRS